MLEQTKFNSKWRLNSFSLVTSHLLNILPSAAHYAENVNSFRNIFRNILNKLDFR
jgi:hypothetical protein